MKEHRSVQQVVRLLSLLGIECPVRPDTPPRPDVFVEFNARRIAIAIETTDFHGDETRHGGSATRRDEQQDAAAGRVRAYPVPIDPLPGLVSRIRAKVSKRYDLSGMEEAWLAIFAGVPQLGATAATFLLPTFLNCHALTAHTSDSLEASVFRCAYILCELTEVEQPKLYSWEKGRAWTEVRLLGQHTPRPSPFWEIKRQFFRKE